MKLEHKAMKGTLHDTGEFCGQRSRVAAFVVYYLENTYSL